MTKFGRIDFKTGHVQDEFTGAFCHLETLAALVATVAASAATSATAATAATIGGTATAAGFSAVVAPSLGVTFGAGLTPVASGGFFSGASGLLANAFSSLATKDFLSGGFALFSASKSIEAGNLAAEASLQSAAFADISAKQELLKGRKEALDLEALTLDEVEQFQAGIGPRGITGSGSARSAQEAAITASNRQQDFATENAQIRAAADAVRAKSLRLDAKAEKATGVLGAAKTVAEFAFKRTARG